LAAFIARPAVPNLAKALSDANSVAVFVQDNLHELGAEAVGLGRLEVLLRRRRVLAARKDLMDAELAGTGLAHGECEDREHDDRQKPSHEYILVQLG